MPSLAQTLEQYVAPLRTVFQREATFRWFIVLVWGFVLAIEINGVTSFMRCFDLPEPVYYDLLQFFRSKAFDIGTLCRAWLEQVLKHAPLMTMNGRKLFLIDGIKAAKEGRKMPGVKLMHQDSGNNSKSEHVYAHFYSALSIVAKGFGQLVAIPVRLALHDGFAVTPKDEPDSPSLVDKMASLVVTMVLEAAYIIGDAYYAATGLIKLLVKHNHHLIAPVRKDAVGFYPPPPPPEKRGPGAPRKRGERVKLKELFDNASLFTTKTLSLYGDTKTVRYYSLDLFWAKLPFMVRFVLTIFPEGNRLILLSTDLTLHPEQIISVYSFRMKIEVMFKVLVQQLCAFAYRFWLKVLPKNARTQGDLDLYNVTDEFRARVAGKVKAYETFVNVAAIAQGCLQMLALTCADRVWEAFPLWLRTRPTKHSLPSELVVKLTLQKEVVTIFSKSWPDLLLQKILLRWIGQKIAAHPHQFVPQALDPAA